jgi:hypothetical protein
METGQTENDEIVLRELGEYDSMMKDNLNLIKVI